jgi:hypothetical protein
MIFFCYTFIHESQTELTEAYRYTQNHSNLEEFLGVLSGGKNVAMETGKMYEGFNIEGMDFMIGKVVTTL